MSESSIDSRGRLADVFAKINMSELPAMSVHVQELLALDSGQRSVDYDDLAAIILKDISLTHKVLQVANSAFYSLGQKVSTVSMAVALLGFDLVREIAVGIALYDDFVQAGGNSEAVGELLACSFMSGFLARTLAETRYLRVLPEEAFICALMRHLGRIVICMYLPEVYGSIKHQVDNGRSEEEAARELLDGLDYIGVGREVAIFWNMTESVINCMDHDPPLPEENDAPGGSLHCIVDFSNRLIDHLWQSKNPDTLMEKYGAFLSLDGREAKELAAAAAGTAEALFGAVRPENPLAPLFLAIRHSCESAPLMAEESTKELEERSHAISSMLSGTIHLKACLLAIVDALLTGMGFERVILAMLKERDGVKVLSGQLGGGDMGAEHIRRFELPLALVREMEQGDAADGTGASPFASRHLEALSADLQPLFAERAGWLFPICLGRMMVALLYVDRRAQSPPLSRQEMEWVERFRDCAVTAITRKRKQVGM